VHSLGPLTTVTTGRLLDPQQYPPNNLTGVSRSLPSCTRNHAGYITTFMTSWYFSKPPAATFVTNRHKILNLPKRSVASLMNVRYISGILMEFEFSWHIFAKYSTIKFHENPSSENRVDPCGRMGRQTDRRTDTWWS